MRENRFLAKKNYFLQRISFFKQTIKLIDFRVEMTFLMIVDIT